MNTETTAETAERLGRRRARLVPMLALVFLIQQIAFFANPPAEPAVDHVRIGAWVVMTAALVLFLNIGGGWFRSAAVRAMLDDELTRANRAGALRWGFTATMIAAIVVYVVQGVTQFTVREVIHLITSAGIVAALVRFGQLERRAHA